MKKIVLLLSAAGIIAAATSCNGGSASMKEQLDSLQTAYEQRNADYHELNEYLQVIATSLDSIALQEGHILTAGESPALSRDDIKRNLEAYKQTLANQRNRIEQLEARLQKSHASTTQLRVILASLKQQIAQKDDEITQLRTQLDNKNMDVNRLTQQLNFLKHRNEMQAGLIVSQQETILAQDAKIKTAYVRIGTKKELKELGLISGGFLKKTKVDFSKLDKKLFKAVNTDQTKTIDIPAKDIKLLTPQPDNSYRIDKVYKSYVLTITDPEQFWGVSDFVIIQVDE